MSLAFFSGGPISTVSSLSTMKVVRDGPRVPVSGLWEITFAKT